MKQISIAFTRLLVFSLTHIPAFRKPKRFNTYLGKVPTTPSHGNFWHTSKTLCLRFDKNVYFCI
jgi:hypothetical protein